MITKILDVIRDVMLSISKAVAEKAWAKVRLPISMDSLQASSLRCGFYERDYFANAHPNAPIR